MTPPKDLNLKPTKKTVTVGSVVFGGNRLQVIAGPCSIESQSHAIQTGLAVRVAGASLLRGGVFKMRTNPKSFQGLGQPAFDFLPEVKSAVEMPLVCEITDPRQLELMIGTVDMFQVGSRNMYNYELLKELGRSGRPVLLKRAFAATVEEWTRAAEYVLSAGNENVVLCERGIRTFETTTRNTLDLNSVAWLKAHTDFPVIVDPSHGTGRRELVAPLALAGLAAGADGLICEVHPDPDRALSDAEQALSFAQFESLMKSARLMAPALGREL